MAQQKQKRISQQELLALKDQVKSLIGQQFESLSLPIAALEAFEPSQIGTIIGSLMDALIPHLPELPGVPGIGITKHGGVLKDREGYPDYKHKSGKRLELKLLYIHNPALKMKTPATPREPSARLAQKVTTKNVDPANDAMLVIAYRMEPQPSNPKAVSPRIIDLAVLSMIELVEARDKRMEDCGGRWFGNFETPTIPSKIGKAKRQRGESLGESYGRKESEGKDYNEDTNFGKLRRIPHKKFQDFLDKYKVGTKKQAECEAGEDDEAKLEEVIDQIKQAEDAR